MTIRSVHDLAAAVRGRRLALELTQHQVADRAGVSRDWINYFEAGKSTVELGHVLRVLDALGLCLDLVPGEREQAPTQGVDLDALLEEYRNR